MLRRQAVLSIGLLWSTFAQAPFEARLKELMARPEYSHSRFGVAIYPVGGAKALYRLNAHELFVPGSTTKLVAVGTALKLIGADYRFRTPIYRTGNVSPDGVLDGDLVVVAGGDMNLSGRELPDGTLAFQNIDHSYFGIAGAAPVPGDPIAAVRSLARAVAAKGIRRVTGKLHIDLSLLPLGDRDLGTGVTISGMAVNDNVIDAFLTAGAKPGDAVQVRFGPDTRYVEAVNHLTTGAADAKLAVRIARDERRADGGRRLTIEGTVPLGSKDVFHLYRVPEAAMYTRFVFLEALAEAGVKVEGGIEEEAGTLSWKSFYQPANLVAEHLSPRFVEDGKYTLKVSQNMHAAADPYLVGAIAGGVTGARALSAGFQLEKKLLTDAGLDVSGAMQSDGAGGAAMFTPDFMCQYLVWLSKQSFFNELRPGLPVLGRDGTLYDIQTASPAAGKVFAKTGTYATPDLLHEQVLVTGKGMAGYMTTRDGQEVAFAFFVNFVRGDPATVTHRAGEMLGEIATAAWESAWK